MMIREGVVVAQTESGRLVFRDLTKEEQNHLLAVDQTIGEAKDVSANLTTDENNSSADEPKTGDDKD